MSIAASAAGLLAGRAANIQRVFAEAQFSQARAQAMGIVQTPLAPKFIPQFIDPLPGLETVIDAGSPFEYVMKEFQTQVLSTGTVLNAGVSGKTTVWGYLPGDGNGNAAISDRASYLGPVVVAFRGQPTEMKFINALGHTDDSKLLAYTQSVDQTLHWADPLGDMANGAMNAEPYSGTIPAAVHLHGGEIPDVLDGGPDSWFASDGMHVGHGFYSKDGNEAKNYVIYRYPNTQEGSLIWFHDHTLGATRLNVYAGLAGGYLLVDSASKFTNPFEYNMPFYPLVIQDRMFDTNGELYFPAGVPFAPNEDHPLWVPEFVGDVILVNGKTWPVLNVEAKRCMFLIINGSNARTYEMFFSNLKTKINGPAMWQVATDGGLLDAPVKIDPNAPKGQLQRLVMMPGERAWIIVDFAGQAGNSLILKNVAKTPYPGGESPDGITLGKIMKIVVGPVQTPEAGFNPAKDSLWPNGNNRVKLVNANGTPAAGVAYDKKRQLTLNEVMGMPMGIYPGGPLEILVNNTKWMEDASETPVEGDTELWEIINLTADAHPMHTHLIQFQLLNRQAFDVGKYNAAYAALFPDGVYAPAYGHPTGVNDPLDYNVPNADGALGGNPAVTPFLKSVPTPPAANELGWKDTVQALPGTVTRFIARFAPTDTPAGQRGVYPFDPATGDGYVWHCHIVDHEDNEMMRPLKVQTDPATPRTINRGPDLDY